MADPLSIAASIAGLVALTDTLFRTVIKFSREVKGAKQEIANLATEVRDLSGVLHNLSLLAASLETCTQETVFRLHHVNSCRQSIIDVQSKLSKEVESLERPKTSKSIARRLLWPFTSTETKSLLSDISRHKDTMTLALAADNMKAMMECLSNLSGLDRKVSAMQEDIREAKEIATTIAMNEKRKEILDFFLIVNPQPSLDVSLRLRHPLTGLWLIDSEPFRQWIESPNAKLWLSGIPGAGKTVLAGLITQQALQLASMTESYGACFFFCDYQDPTSHPLVNIISSLTSQLARQNDEAFEILETYHKSLHPTRGMPKSPDEQRIKEIFLEMADTFTRVYVVIDGLDECGMDPSIVIGLNSLVTSSSAVSMAILSRDELHIQERLEVSFEHIEIAALSGDIQLYVAGELETRIQDRRLKIRKVGLKDEVLIRLVNGAKGMFRWASCQLDYLCQLPTDREIRDALDKLPPTLPATYERILRRDTQPRAIQIIRTALRLISLADPPLDIRQLCDVVSLPDGASSIEAEDMLDEDDIARLCGSLVRKSQACHRDGRPRFELAHFTVKEFLHSPALKGTDLEAYFIDRNEGKAYTTATSLRFLCLDNFNNKVGTPKEAFDASNMAMRLHPFYTFACFHWKYSDINPLEPGVHQDCHSTTALVGRAPQGVFDLALKLFGGGKTPAFVLWSVLIVRRFFHGRRGRVLQNIAIINQTLEDVYEPISLLLHSTFIPLHMTCCLNFPAVTEALLQEGADINLECGLGSAFECAILRLSSFTRLTSSLLLGSWTGSPKDCLETLMILNKYKAPCTSWIKWGDGLHSPLKFTLDQFTNHRPIRDVFRVLSCLTNTYSVPVTAGFLKKFKKWVARATRDVEEKRIDHMGDIPLAAELKKVVEESLISLERDSGELVAIENQLQTDDEYFRNVSTALEYDDTASLRELSRDPKIWNFPQLHSFAASALHVAAYNGSPGAVRLLADLGFDVNCRDKMEMTPLHYCSRPFERGDRSHLSVTTAVLLLDLGASDTAADNNGDNIWHLAALIGWDTLIKHLLERETGCEVGPAHTASNADSLNPAGVALASWRIPTAILLLPRFSNCPGLVPYGLTRPYHLAARNGSVELLQALIDARVPQSPENGEPFAMGTPLHAIAIDAPPECAQQLRSLFPDACTTKFAGQIPLGNLLIECFSQRPRGYCFPDKHTLAELVPEGFSFQTEQGGSFWELLCDAISTQDRDDDEPFFNNDIALTATVFLDALVDRNFIDLAERAATETHLLLFFDALRVLLMNIKPFSDTELIQQSIIGHLRSGRVDRTRATAPDWIFTLFEIAVRRNWRDIASALLERGVSVHDRSAAREGALSAVEAACQAGSICSTGLFQELLDRAGLNETNPALGIPLFHRLARGHLLHSWRGFAKLEALLERGADPNLLGAEGGSPAIVEFILDKQIDAAGLLLDHGADPALCDAHGVNTMLALVWQGEVGGLEDLKRRFEATLDWGKTCSLDPLHKFWSKRTGSCNALHLACLAGSLECLKFLVENTPLNDVHFRSDHGYTCAHFAASSKYHAYDILEYLHTRGADMNAQCQDGTSPLHVAVEFKRKGSIRTLLKLGATLTTDSYGFTPVGNAIVDAVVDGNTEIVDVFNNHDASFAAGNIHTTAGVGGSTLLPALRSAIKRDDLEACRELQRMGCPLDKPIRSCGACLPLFFVLGTHNPDKLPRGMVRWLVQNDGSVWMRICTIHWPRLDKRIRGPIQLVAQYKEYNDILESFLYKYERFWPEWLVAPSDTSSAGHVAIFQDNLAGLKIILDWVVDRQNNSPSRDYPNVPTLDHVLNCKSHAPILCLAAKQRRCELLKRLLEYGANYDIRDAAGRTPLRLAVQERNHDNAKILLKHGANPNARCDRFLFALQTAVLRNDHEMIDILVLNGADPNMRLWNGRSLLCLCTTRKIFQHLLSLGLDPLAGNLEGQPDVHYCLTSDDVDFFILQTSLIHTYHHREPIALAIFKDGILAIGSLLPKMVRVLGKESVKSMIDTEPAHTRSPLCMAAISGALDIIDVLIDIGADLEFEGHPIGTALMTASASGELSAVRHLVRRGAKIHYVSNRIQTISDLFNKSSHRSAVALAERHPDIIRWFLVNRYTEQLKIQSSSGGIGSEEPLRPWSGVRKLEYPLVGDRARQPYNSSIGYLRYLYKVKRSLRGKVLHYTKLSD